MVEQLDKKLLPFKIVSSSVDTGYLTHVSNSGLPNLEFVNMHRDLYSDLDNEPLQGVFTAEHVGGEQHRHVRLNPGNDTDFTRPEFYKIQITSSAINFYGPENESVDKPRVSYWRGRKALINVANISNFNNILGNFQKNYEIFQTSGRGLNNNLIADGYTASVDIVPTSFIYGANNFTLPDLTTSSKSIIVERFNAPGDKKQSSRGVLDRAGEEYAANNSLVTRNITARQPFYNQLTQHSPQFGSGSTYQLLPATGNIDTVSIHKVNRNTFKTLLLSDSTVVSGAKYDNYWVQYAIPRSNFGYAWISASTISNPYNYTNFEFDITASFKNKPTIDLSTQTILNSLSASDAYYSSWKQIRTGEHPVARKLREENYFSIQDIPRSVQRFDGRTVVPIRSGKSTNYKDPPVTNKYYPIKQRIQFRSEPDGTSTALTYTYRNNIFNFANQDIDRRLNLVRKVPQFYNQLVQSKNAINSPIKNILNLSFKENIFPKALNTYLSGTRSRTEYILDQPGFDRDGYDRQLGTQRVFWRDSQEDRRRSPNSSGGHINSLGYSSLEESGSNFVHDDIGILYDNSFIILSSSLSQSFSNLDKGINNSIISLESGSGEREIFVYTGSFIGTFYNYGNYAEKILANVVKRGFTGDIAGELNNSYIDFYEQFTKNNKKQSIGAIYKNSSYKSLINSLSTTRDLLPDTVSRTEDEEIFPNPKPRYISFLGGGELNTGSIFDNSSNFSNTTFNTFLSSPNNIVRQILVSGSYIFIGGSFSTIGSVYSNGFSFYDINTQKFYPFGSSLNNTVRTIAISGTDIYVGGDFTNAGGISGANRIAKWSMVNNSWSAVASGINNNNVQAIAFSGTDIYVGGDFINAGGIAEADCIAKYNTLTNTWSALGSGLNSTVREILVSGTDIYVGGQFTDAGGTGSADNIAKWSTTGSSWSALGSGITSISPGVYTLALSGTDLYIGGDFQNAGGIAEADRIAKYNTLTNTWSALGNGLNSYVYSIAFSGTDIYVGGIFTNAGGTGSADYIAKWSITGSSWSALSSDILFSGGVIQTALLALAVSGNDIYIGGDFASAGGNIAAAFLAKWDTESKKMDSFNTNKEYNYFSHVLLNNNLNLSDVKFSTLDSGLINIKNKFVSYDNSENYYKSDVYQTAKEYSIIPEFKISDQIEKYIDSGNNFKITNNEFLLLDGIGNKYKSADSASFSFNKEQFFEKYSFTDILNKNNIENSYLNELKQETINISVSGIKKLLPYNGFYPQDRTIQLGNFYSQYVDNVLSGGVYNLNNINDYYGDTILSGNYIGTASNYFDIISNIDVLKYNNKQYLIADNLIYLNNSIRTIAISGTDIYVGGDFTNAGGVSGANRIAKLDSLQNTWSALGSGLNSTVNTIAVSGTDIYVGGQFTDAGGIAEADRIVKWSTTGSSWSALGSGLNNTVNTIAVSGTDIYVGGQFTSIGSEDYIAKWSTTGSSWSALGSGLNSFVYSIAVSGTDIYVGGIFTNAGGIAEADRIAKWSTTGSSWSALGSGLSGSVNTIAVSGTDIYVGGVFTDAGGIAEADRIAKWSTTGSSWSALGSGLNNTVNTIAVSGTDIYVGGLFTDAGGIAEADRIAKWNSLTNTWSPLNFGLNNTANSIAIFGNDIYVGGTFTNSVSANYLNNFRYLLNYNVISENTNPVILKDNYLYSSSLGEYKIFNQNPIANFKGLFNARLLSASNGLNIFYFTDVKERKLSNLFSINTLDWTKSSNTIEQLNSGDNFGEYWDYIYQSSSLEESILFCISSPNVTTGSKISAGAVSLIKATMSGSSWNYSNKIILGTGSAEFNEFGTGISMISCSSGYQVFTGELFGDNNSTNFGNIWLVTSSNGIDWSVPISIISGSYLSASLGFNNIKAINFSKNGLDKSYLFFSEPFSNEPPNVVGKFFVISSSANNYWGATDFNSQRTELYSFPASETSTNLDVTGSNKNSIQAFSNKNSIIYCFVNGIDSSEQLYSEILIGTTLDGNTWQTQDQMYRIVNSNTRGGDVVGLSTYEKQGFELPVFFTNISSSAGINSIYAIHNNQYTEYSLNVSESEKYVKQAALEPIMAPGILYNSIKSGIAVDWPCATGSQTAIQPYGSGTIVNAYYPQSFKMASHTGQNINELNMYGSLRSNIDYRVEFEKLIFPDDIFPVKQELTSSLLRQTILSTLESDEPLVQFISGCYIYGGYEPYMSPVDFSDFNQLGPKRFSVPFVYRKENAKNTGLYSLAMSNFLAETVKFFLKDGLLTSFESRPDSQWGTFEKGKTYYMDIVMSKTPNLVMMEAYHSSKHPTGSYGEKMNGRYFGYPVNKTNKKLWSADSDALFTSEESKLIHNDPAYAPYTPPYFEGEATARVSFSPKISRKYSIDEIFAELVVEDIFPGVVRGAHTGSDAYLNKMPVESSVNIKGKLPWIDFTKGSQNTTTTNNDINTWVISTRFETPVLDFSSQSLTPYENNYMKSSGYGRGMWSGYGDIPSGRKGIYLSLRESFPQKINIKRGSTEQSLLQKVGFRQTSKKIGLLAEQKVIKEAVMVIPFIETINTNNLRKFSYSNIKSKVTKLEKELGIEFIGVRRDIYKQVIEQNIDSSILDTVNSMSEFIVPPQLDYTKDETIDPFVAYIIPFEHKLSQQELADIWQGVAPEIAQVAEFDEQSISHPNKVTEFFHGEGMPNDIRFMVFKIKQRGEFDYFKVTRDSTDDNSFERELGRKIGDYSYNWPYDFCSLVELAKVDVQIDYSNKRTQQSVTTTTQQTTTAPVVASQSIVLKTPIISNKIDGKTPPIATNQIVVPQKRITTTVPQIITRPTSTNALPTIGRTTPKRK